MTRMSNGCKLKVAAEHLNQKKKYQQCAQQEALRIGEWLEPIVGIVRSKRCTSNAALQQHMDVVRGDRQEYSRLQCRMANACGFLQWQVSRNGKRDGCGNDAYERASVSRTSEREPTALATGLCNALHWQQESQAGRTHSLPTLAPTEQARRGENPA